VTQPGGGGSGIESGEDYVSARLGVNVDEGSMGNLRQLTQEVERFHTAMEATVRAEADMTRYLDQMVESTKAAAQAQTNLTQQLSVYMSMQGRMSGGGGMGYPGVAGGGAVQPFMGGMPGMGSGAPGMPPGARPPSPTDVVWQTGGQQQAAQVLNMQHARGNLTSADTMNISPGSIQALADQIALREKAVQHGHQAAVPHTTNQPARQGAAGDITAQLQQRLSTGMGLTGQVMNEIGGGGGGLAGMASLAQRGLNWASSKIGSAAKGGGEGENDEPEGGGKKGDDDKTGLGGVAKGLGVAGVGIAAIAGVADLVGKAGQMQQGWRNIGGMRGGGAGEGFEASMAARSTAMDPNITTEQARSMYQATISEGYATASGGGASDIMELLRTELKQLNQSTVQVIQELRLGRIGHDQVVSAAAIEGADLALKQQAKGGYVALPDLIASRNAEWQSQVAQGVGPAQAFQNANVGTNMYADNPALAGKYGAQTFAQPALGAMEMQYGGAGGTPMPPPTGLQPGAYAPWLKRAGKSDEAQANVIKKLALRAQTLTGDKSGGKDNTDPAYFQAVQYFMGWMRQSVDTTSDDETLEAYYLQYVWGVTPDGDPVSSDPKQVVAQARKDNTKNRRNAGDFNVSQRGGGGPGGTHTRATYGSHMTDNIVAAYGGDVNQVQVGDGKGGWATFDPHNQQQQQRLSSGDINWRHKGDKGGGIKEEDTPDDIGKKFSTDNPWGTAGTSRKNPNAPGGGGQVSGNLTVTIDQAGVAHAPKSVPLTPTQQGANQGARGVQVNQPPPGDRGFDRGMWAGK
jgi:hypothetical protein